MRGLILRMIFWVILLECFLWLHTLEGRTQIGALVRLWESLHPRRTVPMTLLRKSEKEKGVKEEIYRTRRHIRNFLGERQYQLQRMQDKNRLLLRQNESWLAQHKDALYSRRNQNGDILRLKSSFSPGLSRRITLSNS